MNLSLSSLNSSPSLSSSSSSPSPSPRSTYSTPDKQRKSAGIQLDSDGCLVKRVIKEGYGELPPPRSLVTVHYEAYLSNNQLFDSSLQRNLPFTFQLGTSSVVEAIEMAVPTMKVGQEAEIVSTQKYAFGKLGLPPYIPPNVSVIFKIKLLSFKFKQNDYNNFEALITRAKEEKETGNQFYNKTNYKKAIRHYVKGIWILSDPEQTLGINEGEDKLLKETFIVLYLNLASCHIKLKDGKRALSTCEKILELGGNTAKFYFRMGQAYALNKQFDSAKRSVIQAIRLEPIVKN
ncbi:hypothetical protein DICPUDRAFT_77144 [Dictyostelium purpureum]|uniref:peptidylprolyl isomerase n=1 Tax=Dictyostelium purpureum TaxID=5786 RepID=F0ZFQ8_DICPU|nr:uncharacterized protein DICPUDRAFT_77144 [Dictyostelium purpureum]EGC37198.1 hypothetical protein DICPUDRAFT_77144 [Dictyostelium purpureum]|eukprot:XP_003286249.1 hypothetical protein DICPUDRAFT_77144 [Dictyostelium purpureum]